MKVRKGIPVSPGYAIKRAVVFDQASKVAPRREIVAEELPAEIDRYEKAVQAAIAEIQALAGQTAQSLGEEYSAIFATHATILKDKVIHDEVRQIMQKDLVTPEYAVSSVLRKYVKQFREIPDPFFSQRATDLQDIQRRLVARLMGEKMTGIEQSEEEFIVVAHEMTPSETATLDRDSVSGFATDVGGRTAHTAIMARAMGIPAVVGLENISAEVQNGDQVIIDGVSGVVVINPDEETVKRYHIMARAYRNRKRRLKAIKDLPAETKDGFRVELLANIDIPREIGRALKAGADGVGLFRTEYIFYSPLVELTEETHYEAYAEAIERCGEQLVVIRTLDMGGDKFFQHLGGLYHEYNPFLGLRSIRICFERLDLFKPQLRAILRASVKGNVCMIFPMISSMDELEKAKNILEQVKEELENEGVAFNRELPLGIMVEVPSAVTIIDMLAKEVDFLSIGTNDLVQYTLAVDRVNEHIADYYQTAHPAILRMFARVVEEGEKQGKKVTICGEMAGEPMYAPLLVGLGVRKLSMSPAFIPAVKKVIRSMTLEEARDIAAKCLTMKHERDINSYLQSKVRRYMRDDEETAGKKTTT